MSTNNYKIFNELAEIVENFIRQAFRIQKKN